MVLDSIKILKKKRIKFNLIYLSNKSVSLDDVVKSSKKELNPVEICKTIIVKDEEGNIYAFMLKGFQKIDFSKVREVLGKKVSILSIDELRKATGKEPGSICPLILDSPLFVDKDVFKTKKINFGSGSDLIGIEIFSKDLDKIVDFKIVDIAF